MGICPVKNTTPAISKRFVGDLRGRGKRKMRTFLPKDVKVCCVGIYLRYGILSQWRLKLKLAYDCCQPDGQLV